ncbi:MAG: hypothetical protein OXH68_21210 [Gammaproteobacteria bacterium]|nr:hypothetical protein [Gammaproteobacteria bacterium]
MRRWTRAAAVAATWAVCLASSGAALADVQKVTVHTSANSTDYNPAHAPVVLETKVVWSFFPPNGGRKDVWGPVCVDGLSAADCAAARDIYVEVQETAKVLGDKKLGDQGTLHVIVMENNHPQTVRGLYDPRTKSVVLYPNRAASTLPHEVAHVYVGKHIGTQTASGIKSWGAEEGFAKITAHRVTGDSGAGPPSADNVTDILNGTNCTTHGSTCAHDIGNLVVDAYEDVAWHVGEVDAYKVYRDALRRLTGLVMTPASLHEKVGQILEERYPRLNIHLPNIPDPFDLPIWDAWWQIFWLGVELC